ncbi:MAG TPA: adenylate/guanylate cyclase domain-containing protein [Anaerolineae bacterium]|nr:adenylate/guanylate cyclase domain-containing protein [Anaerolineae bacterium]
MEILSVRRLLNRRDANDYLKRYARLLPDVVLGIYDQEHLLTAVRCAADAGEVADVGRQETIAWERRLPVYVNHQESGALVAAGPGLAYPTAADSLAFLHHSLILLLERSLEARSLAEETLERYREINLLYNIGETISASLDPDEIPDLVMAEAGRIIRAHGGIVLLFNEKQEMIVRSGFGSEEFVRNLHPATHSLLLECLKSGEPQIWAAAQLDLRDSVITAVLQAPLKAREHILGFVLLGRDMRQPIFTADDKKLLTALASQAAIAMENARLFADVKSQRDAIAEMKNYMDNIFASIASGVITTDTADTVTLINRAAERILGVLAEQTVGACYADALSGLGDEILPLMDVIKQRDESVVGYELQPTLPKRGPVVLRLSLSPLKDNREATNGIAIVLDDLTEQRRLEAQARRIRQTFEQYVVPRVVEQLLSDPTSVRLGGVRRELTTLFADIRGFTTFSEKLAPEESVDVLNRYLTLASEAILSEEGTLDKFFGDGVMALFNAPLSQPDHTLRAVRSALKILDALKVIHQELPPINRLAFGIGITTGPAVVGSIGSTMIKNYTAIGDSVNLASRLQSHAEPMQILLNVPAYQQVAEHVIAREIGYVQVKGHSEPDLVYEVLGLRAP